MLALLRSSLWSSDAIVHRFFSLGAGREIMKYFVQKRPCVLRTALSFYSNNGWRGVVNTFFHLDFSLKYLVQGRSGLDNKTYIHLCRSQATPFSPPPSHHQTRFSSSFSNRSFDPKSLHLFLWGSSKILSVVGAIQTDGHVVSLTNTNSNILPCRLAPWMLTNWIDSKLPSAFLGIKCCDFLIGIQYVCIVYTASISKATPGETHGTPMRKEILFFPVYTRRMIKTNNRLETCHRYFDYDAKLFWPPKSNVRNCVMENFLTAVSPNCSFLLMMMLSKWMDADK